MLTQTQLIERGWTKTLIKRFLGAPDDTRTNPHYRSGPTIKLFAMERVEGVEDIPECKAALEKIAAKRPKRKQRSLEVATRRKEDELARVELLEIRIPMMSRDSLRRQAIESYNSLHFERGEVARSATGSTDENFLRRIETNFLRHCGTDYHVWLEDLYNKVGCREAYTRLKSRIMEAIYVAYQHLS